MKPLVLLLSIFLLISCSPSDNFTHTVVASDLNIRSEPDGDKVGALQKGDRVIVVETENGWARLSTGNWVNAAYLQTLNIPPIASGLEEIPKDVVVSKPLDKHCDLSDQRATGIYAGVIDTDLREKPNQEASRILNKRASDILGRNIYHPVSVGEEISVNCFQSNWAQISKEIGETEISGWIEVDSLRKIDFFPNGKRIYVEEDFAELLKKREQRFLGDIVTVVNRISENNERCLKIEPASLQRSTKQPGSRRNPRFFVTCSAESLPFNVWFNAKDSTSDTTFAAKVNMPRTMAAEMCREAAKASSNFPSTVSFSAILDFSYTAYMDGRSVVKSSFTAKNAYNLKFEYEIECRFSEFSLDDVQIREKS